MPFDVNALREQFPALQRRLPDGQTPIYFDNPAGTQVPQAVIDAVAEYFTVMNANSGGVFDTSRRSDEMVSDVRQQMADFLGAENPDEVAFGPNMTTLIFGLSRALAQTFHAGDEIILTRMDHDANVSPWLLIARDHNLTVRWVDINPADCTLDLDSLQAAVSSRTRLIATVHASNAVGTVNPVHRIAEIAAEAGALYVIDAVQSAPHVPIDVQAIGCDFLLCSTYKFFGPHLGVMWGRHDLLETLPAYKVRPAKDASPYRWETGTPAFESIAAAGAALDYIAEIGLAYGLNYADDYPRYDGQMLDLKLGMEAIRAYERGLMVHMLDVLAEVPGLTVHGITDSDRLMERVPTFACTIEGSTPQQISEFLAGRGIYTWAGHYYALEIMERLGHAEHGMLRIGPVHYNTLEEIDRLGEALRKFVSNGQ